MVIFMSDDFQYRRWLAMNPDGYVLNCCYQAENTEYPRLHRAACRNLNAPRVEGYSPRDYFKACAADTEELEKYAGTKFGRLRVCPLCSPHGDVRLL
ncbi:MAG: hypothetical protein ACOX8W_11550 [bacterium]